MNCVWLSKVILKFHIITCVVAHLLWEKKTNILDGLSIGAVRISHQTFQRENITGEYR